MLTRGDYGPPGSRRLTCLTGGSTHVGSGRTRVQWTYSFQLNRSRFPGSPRRIGDLLFRVGFLDREYAEMMWGLPAGSKARTEGNIPVVASGVK
jgi:hypothetical protein